MSKAAVLRVMQDLKILAKDPIPGIFVIPSEENILRMDALIIGPTETPYAHGFFHFTLSFGEDYPTNPPKVSLKTTDGGRTRFNPNLYACGKVCLSILGTWSGPAWQSSLGLGTILLSIQSLMCANPYGNEPGFESRSDPAASTAYNEAVSHEKLRVAVAGMLEAPTCGDLFRDQMEHHFILWYDEYIRMCDEKIALDGGTIRDFLSGIQGRFDFKRSKERLIALKETMVAKWPAEIVSPENEYVVRSSASRLREELAALKDDPPFGMFAAPVSESNIFEWEGSITGVEGTPFESNIIPFRMLFNKEYPVRAPRIWFTCKMFHPNINAAGIPCLDMLDEFWDEKMSIESILLSLSQMLNEPCLSTPVDLEAASMYRDDPRAYRRKVRRLFED